MGSCCPDEDSLAFATTKLSPNHCYGIQVQTSSETYTHIHPPQSSLWWEMFNDSHLFLHNCTVSLASSLWRHVRPDFTAHSTILPQYWGKKNPLERLQVVLVSPESRGRKESFKTSPARLISAKHPPEGGTFSAKWWQTKPDLWCSRGKCLTLY